MLFEVNAQFHTELNLLIQRDDTLIYVHCVKTQLSVIIQISILGMRVQFDV